MTPVEGRWRRLLGCLLIPLLLPSALALSGCNIFSWTHDEGSSDDPETLLQDAEDALLDQKWDEALAAAKKGIALDPNLDVPRLRYVASQAVLGGAGVSVSSYYNVFTNQPKPGFAGKSDGGMPHVADVDTLLDISVDELIAIAQACPQSVAFLGELLTGLESGQITPADLLGIEFDVEIGFGIGALLSAFVTTLDVDQNLDNGFVLNNQVNLLYDDQLPGYLFSYTGPGDPNTFIRQTLLCPLWDTWFCPGLNALYDAYRTAATPEGWPEDMVCGVGGVGSIPTSPPLDDSYVAGQILAYVQDGLALLQQTYLGPGCP